MDFDTSFSALIGNEGGYTPGRGDPGGETKFGISKRSYPMEDIPNLTLERARDIYRHDYWAPAGCDALPEPIKFDLFDMAVNSGVHQAVRTLQRAVGQTEDGLLGSKTLMACQSMSPDRLVMRFNACRLLFMTDLAIWPAFGRGWAKRIATNVLHA